MDPTQKMAEALADIIRKAIQEAVPEAPQVAPTEPIVLTVDDAASILRTSSTQIYAYIRSGRLAAFHLERDQRKYLIYRDDLMQLIDSLRRESA